MTKRNSDNELDLVFIIMRYPENQLAQKTFIGNKTIMKSHKVNSPTLTPPLPLPCGDLT